MRIFVLRARAAPVESARFLAGVGAPTHVEILAHALMNAFFIAQSHRPHVLVHMVLESTQDYSRTVSFEIDAMGTLGGFDEATLLALIARALDASRGMGKEESRVVEAGITVRTLSFERLIAELAERHPLYVLHPKGTPIAEARIEPEPCFILTDHIPMPKKTFATLDRLGASHLSLGRTMLFASQCVVLIHHALDA